MNDPQPEGHMASHIGRRKFLATLGGAAAAWPLAARAQQTKMPTIGVLGTASAAAWSPWTAAFVLRLRELGWIDGRTVAIEYQWADGRNERLRDCRGVCPAQGGCHPHVGRGGVCGKAGYLDDPNRVGDFAGPRRQRPGGKSCATGR